MPSNSNPAPWRRHAPKLLIVLLAAVTLAGGAYLAQRKSPEDHLQAAAELRQSGDIKGEVIALKSALQGMPGNADVRLRLARAQLETNDFAAAEKELLKARDLGLQSDELSLLLARTLLALRKPDQVLSEVQSRQGAPVEINASLLAYRARAQLLKNDLDGMNQSLVLADAQTPDHPDTLWVRAEAAKQLGNTAQALQEADAGLAKSPKHAELWVLKGDLQQQLKQPQAALDAYAKALEAAPNHIPARLSLIQAHVEARQYDKAERELKALDKYSPGNLQGLYYAASVDAGKKRYNEAWSKTQNLLRAAPDYLPARLLAAQAALALGKHQEAQTHLQRVLEAHPDEPLARRLMAITLLELGQVAPAKVMVNALSKEGDDSMLAMLRGGIALREGEFSSARADLTKAAAEAKDYPRVHIDLASSQEATGDIPGAIQSLQRASALEMTSLQADYLLVTMLIRHKRYDEALKAVDAMQVKKPGPGLQDNVRGIIFLARKDLANARASFNKAIAADAKLMSAVTNLANMDVEAGDFKKAREHYQKAMEASPNNLDALVGLAIVAEAQNDDATFQSMLEKAKKAAPTHSKPREMLARHWLARNNAPQALSEAREALAATGNKGFHELIGLAQMRMNDPMGAQATFEKWARDTGESAPALAALARAQASAGKRELALRTVNEALQSQPQFFPALSLKMSLLAGSGAKQEALNIARLIQEKYPQAAIGYQGEADVLLAEKKPLEAARMFQKAAQLSGESGDIIRAYQSLALAGQAASGIDVLGEWLRTRPADNTARHQLALALSKLKRHKEAAEQYRYLVKTTPGDLTAHNNLAMMLSEMKDPGALAVAESAYKLNSDNPAIQDTLGWILVHGGQAQRGIKLLKQAADQMADVPEYRYRYAAGLAAMGEPVLARHELEQVLKSGKPFPQAEEARKLLESLKR